MRGRGQVLVLWCLMILVVAVAVAATVELGRAIDRRIRDQDHADAAAYSMAAIEARAFNTYALANRTQVSHYVSAMAFQSLLSFLYYNEAFLTDLYGLMVTIDRCAGPSDPFWAVACPALKALPTVGPVLGFLDRSLDLFGRWVEVYQRALRSSEIDQLIGRRIIPTLRGMNELLGSSSRQAMLRTAAVVAQGAAEVWKNNDPSAPEPASSFSALSACLFDRAHFDEAGGSPFSVRLPAHAIDPRERKETSKKARAKRAMAQIANATRYGCSGERRCAERFLTSRRWGDLVPIPSWLKPIGAFLDRIPKWGQTRLLSYNLGKGWTGWDGGNFIREPSDTPDAPSAMLAQGDNLGADDVYELSLGGPKLGPIKNPFFCQGNYWECWGNPGSPRREDRPFRYRLKTSIWAVNDQEVHVHPGGLHWRVAYPGGYPSGRGYQPPSARSPALARIGLNQITRFVLGIPVTAFVANVRPIEDGNHPWAGIAPFPHFEPGRYFTECLPAPFRTNAPSAAEAASRREDFNQPSTWVFFHRTQPDASVVARGQCYYHRPGNWAEQPNFFNPYWKARLAAVVQARSSPTVVSTLIELLPPVLRRAPQRALTH